MTGNMTRQPRRTRRRLRRVTYFNPPFSLNVDTNVGKRFLKIVKDFPKNNVLAPIVNANNIKISFRTLQNMGGEISRHNKKILGGEVDTLPPTCNCRPANRDRCPLPDSCTITNIVYCVTVRNKVDNSVETYTGLTANPITFLALSLCVFPRRMSSVHSTVAAEQALSHRQY